MLGEFIQADVAAVNSHGLGMGRESADGGAVVEPDVTDLDVIGEAGGAAIVIETGDFHEVFAMGHDGTGEIVKLGELVAQADVFECAGIVFGGEEVIALFEPETLADIFEGVGVGPANAHGFFSQGEGLFTPGMNNVFRLDPVDLVGRETLHEHGVGIDFQGREDGGHNKNGLMDCWIDGLMCGDAMRET